MSFRTKINIVFVTALLFLLVISFSSYRSINALVENSTWVTHTHEVIQAVSDVLSDAKDLETGQRGYIITGKEEYLEPYNAASTTIDKNLDKLQKLTSDNQNQQQRLAELRNLKNQKMAEFDQVIQIRKTQGFEPALTQLLTNSSKATMDKLRALSAEIKAEEERLLTLRNENTNSSTRITSWIITIGASLSILVLIVSMIVVNVAESKRLVASRQVEEQNRLRAGLIQLSEKVTGEQSISSLAKNIIETVAAFVNAKVGAIYLANESGILKRVGSYALREDHMPNEFRPGEGLVGQVAVQKTPLFVSDAPESYFKVNSGTGESAPKYLYLFPFLHEGKVKGISELATFSLLTPADQDYLKLGLESIAIAFNSAQSRAKVAELLEETQTQSEELQAQQEELRAANEELQGKTQELEAQQEELKQANEELEEQRSALEEQKEKLEQINRGMEKAQVEIEEKAKEVERASKYKSEFLANMSHELRTPLNSILLLSKSLSENTDGNLTGEQEEISSTIYSSGSDLLNLINDILDLSKVEAGKLDIKTAEMDLSDLATGLENLFRPQMAAKGLNFNVEIGSSCPQSIVTDRLRLEQILKNFLSNSVKFTQSGKVSVRFDRPTKEIRLATSGLRPESTVAFSVADTGIGIPEDKKKRIFEAFEQLDSATSRKYGGAGLGLTIARKISELLGGEIHVESSAGEGSRFTIYLPERLELSHEATVTRPKENVVFPPTPRTSASTSTPIKMPSTSRPRFGAHGIEDDRKTLAPEKRTVLIVEDDPVFAKILFNLCHNRGLQCLLAGDGESGLADVQEFSPSAVILDLKLPGMSGMTVLGNLKGSSKTRHIPVHVMSVDDRSTDVLKMGAIGFLSKPASREGIEASLLKIQEQLSRKAKTVLVVEDKKIEREIISKMIGNGDVKTVGVESAHEALDRLKAEVFDCMILDLKLPGMSGFELLEEMEKSESLSRPPVIVYTGRDLSTDEIEKLQKFSESIIIKGARSEERLLDEVTLFLHRVESELSKEQQQILERVRHREEIFEGKKVLIVDDDMRNVFALRSIFAKKGFEIVVAKNGKDALDKLDENVDTDVVLMDIMMPEMDGYEAMKRIRAQTKFAKLPIIALTAKAMASDREKCLEAGANDYLAKPIDMDSLLSLLRVWLSR